MSPTSSLSTTVTPPVPPPPTGSPSNPLSPSKTPQTDLPRMVLAQPLEAITGPNPTTSILVSSSSSYFLSPLLPCRALESLLTTALDAVASPHHLREAHDRLVPLGLHRSNFLVACLLRRLADHDDPKLTASRRCLLRIRDLHPRPRSHDHGRSKPPTCECLPIHSSLLLARRCLQSKIADFDVSRIHPHLSGRRLTIISATRSTAKVLPSFSALADATSPAPVSFENWSATELLGCEPRRLQLR